MKPDNTRQDQQSLRDEFGSPQAVHATVLARVAERRPDVYRTGMSRIEYATELAALIHDDPHVEHVFRQRRDLRDAWANAAAIAATRR